MKTIRTKMFQLMFVYFAGNYYNFGRELGISPSYLHRYLNTGEGGGKKLTGAVIEFCKSKGLDFGEYVEL